MNVKHTPYLTDGSVPKQYPWLTENQSCEVCVVGGGLTAALCALRLTEQGRSVVLIADREIGFGEDACLPVAAEADFGRTLVEMSRGFDMETSLRLYTLGSAALDELENLCHSLDADEGRNGFSTGFERRDSLLYTDDESELELLDREYLARRHNSFDCTRITREMVRDSFSFDIAGGILSKDFGGALNPYHLMHLCLMRAETKGAGIFEHGGMPDIETPSNQDGSVVVTTAAGRRIYADRLILATGSRGIETVLPDFRRRRRYESVSIPVPSEEVNGWPGLCHIRTFGAPHFTFAFTPDRRIAASEPEHRMFGLGDRVKGLMQIPDPDGQTFARIEDTADFLFPAIPTMRTAFEYAQTYRIAPDGLPVIGTHTSFRNCIFALCTGPGEVLYSMLAAGYAADLIEGRHNPDMDLFKVTR